ncbi:MAG TPA: uroporphyrinogen decarboxylase [Microbacteriaceae bacterium]|nr:uroporphyrinogen decarboxylase [Microbacteriaceae bacterium]
MTLAPTHPLNAGATSRSPLICAMRGHSSETIPVWFMRQAGRSLPEYRALREGRGMLDSCLAPELAIEITLQPVRRHGVDAAIFFSDIVVPLRLAGIDVDIEAGIGPVLSEPIRSAADVQRLRPIEPEALAPIHAAVRGLVAELGGVPLIGFGGAPFTLASYLIEGGPSREMPTVRAMMRDEPHLWNHVLDWCADVTAVFIRAQVESGASALQVFDSWAGRLSADEYRRNALPASRRLFSSLSDLSDADGVAVPRVHFGVGTREILEDMASAGATVMGIDSETPLREAGERLPGVPLQGNLAVELLSRPWPDTERALDALLREGRALSGHVVNLGHGVPKDTDPDVLTRIVETVHRWVP